MSKFIVTIEEHLVQSWDIEAKDMEEAEEIAKEKYRSGEFSLDKTDKTTQLMQIEDLIENTATEWFEFT